MGGVIVRLKGGGSFDPIIGRFTWWVLDGPPIMELLSEPVLDCSIPSIEQLAFAASFIKNCCFKYEPDALRRVIEWSNSIKLKITF